MQSQKISLKSAILMNLNIMAGAGIFINIAILTQKLQLLGGLLYLLVGCFTFPLIFTFAQLSQMYPVGGFYAFARPMSPFLGFISCWSYFFGKLASVVIYLHVVTRFLQQLVPYPFAHFHPLVISLSILALYMYLNCQNLRLGVIIQQCFAAAKTIPMILLIILGIYHLDLEVFSLFPFNAPYMNFIFTLPSVLYCFSGFEAACSVSRNIENAQINAPKAIFYSFFSIILLYITFQTLIGTMLMPNISKIDDYAQAYPYLMHLVPTNPWLQAKLTTAISLLIGFSAMGAAYGILFSNAWNLYTLAQNNHTFANQTIVTLNKHSAPQIAVFIEGLICILFLAITGGNLLTLQQISTLGGTVMYTISSIAFLRINPQARALAILSLITCSGFIISCLMSAYQHSLISLYLFLALTILGMLMYWVSSKK